MNNILTWARHESGSLRFYLDGKLVRIVPNDELPGLILTCAQILQQGRNNEQSNGRSGLKP
jgi:hypothetical protein